jgi:hypothetical protein
MANWPSVAELTRSFLIWHHFLNKKQCHFRKHAMITAIQKSDGSNKRWTENEVAERLRRGELLFPPAELHLCSEEVPVNTTYGRRSRADGILEAEWQGRIARFVFEYKALQTPVAIDSAIAQVRYYSNALKINPLIIVPYLSEGALCLLEAEGVSGVDLNGNGILISPEMAIRRSGEPNRYKTSQPIRNVYRGVNSLIPRSFLLRSAFPSLVELQSFAQERLMRGESFSLEAKLTKGTVSKVVQVLEEEKIVLREGGSLRLLNARALLDGLRNSYAKPRERRMSGKTSLSFSEMWKRLQNSGIRCVTTGNGSAGHYRVLSSQEKLSLYVDDFDSAINLLEIEPGPLFPNVELLEEPGDVVYFDARKDGDTLWASPIQTWLELSPGDPREQEAAKGLETLLLQGKGEQF